MKRNQSLSIHPDTDCHLCHTPVSDLGVVPYPLKHFSQTQNETEAALLTPGSTLPVQISDCPPLPFLTSFMLLST